MTITLDFLDLVLPESGLRCAFVQQYKRNYFFNTNEELAAFVLQWDAAGYTVYHACATFKTDASRKGENVEAAAAFWGDVDAGEGKPYADANTAARAVADVVGRAGLPAPLYVFSGRGLHLYWPLDSEIGAGLWRRYATGLRSVLRQAGLHFDPARSCDIASILRTPGTTHRKEAVPLPVVAAPLVEQIPLVRFAFLLEHADEKESNYQPTSMGDIPSWLRRPKPPHVADRATFCSPGLTGRSDPIADRCQQVDRLRNWRIHKQLPEPVWFDVLGVLAFTEDGDECAHRWSAGHNQYVPGQTQDRLDRKRELTGATTCSRFHHNEPAICERCSLWGKIKSPIILGLGSQTDRNTAISDSEAHSAAAAQVRASVTESAGSRQLPALPWPFGWRGQSLVLQTESNGQAKEILISQYPIYLETPNRDEVKQDFSLTFTHLIPALGWQQFTIPMVKLLGSGGLPEIGRYGVNLAHDAGSHFLRYVRAALDEAYKNLKMQTRYDQYGWKDADTAFLFGRKLYTSTGSEITCTGSEELKIRNEWLGPGAGHKSARQPEKFGLAQWTASANSLFAAGCEAQSVALLASFAASLMRFFGTDEGGAIVSLVTKESGSGKTTAMAGAFSVWGARQGLSITADDNNVTKWLTLGALGNIPLVHDEIATRDPIALKELVITFTNGRDKMRATRDGQIRHSASTWQTILVTASNSSLIDSLTSGSEEDAPQYRVLELSLEVPEGLRFQMGDELKTALIANAGYAGEAYVKRIAQPAMVAWIKNACAHYLSEIWLRTGGDQKQRFRVRTIAAIAVAGIIINDLGLVSFSTDRIVDYLVNRVKAEGKRQQDMAGNWDTDSLGEFISIEGPNFLLVPNDYKRPSGIMRPVREPRSQMTGCYCIQDKKLFATMQAMRLFAVEHDIPFRQWQDMLARRNIMRGDPFRRKLTLGTDLPGGSVNVIELDLNHPLLGEVDAKLAIKPGDDTTNVTVMRR